MKSIQLLRGAESAGRICLLRGDELIQWKSVEERGGEGGGR